MKTIKLGSATINVDQIEMVWDPSYDRGSCKIGIITRNGIKIYQSFDTEAAAWEHHAHILATMKTVPL